MARRGRKRPTRRIKWNLNVGRQVAAAMTTNPLGLTNSGHWLPRSQVDSTAWVRVDRFAHRSATILQITALLRSASLDSPAHRRRYRQRHPSCKAERRGVHGHVKARRCPIAHLPHESTADHVAGASASPGANTQSQWPTAGCVQARRRACAHRGRS